MNILQVSRHHWDISVGGVESYLKDLIEVLKDQDVHSDILTFFNPGDPPVFSGPSNKTFLVPLLNYIDTKSFTDKIHQAISASHYDAAHIHFFRPEEALVAQVLNNSGIPCVFTFHLPASLCYRGALMHWGTKVCNGAVRTFRCTACRIHRRIYPLSPVFACALTPLMWVVSWFYKTNFYDGFRSSPDYWGVTRGYALHLKEFLNTCRFSIACGKWSIDVLKKNGLPEERIAYIPQGLPSSFGACVKMRPAESRILRIGYIGRISEEKGVHLLIKAFLKTVSPDAQLLIHGASERKPTNYENYLRNLAAGDKRIQFHTRVPHDKIRQVYDNLDILAVPSNCPETGPLVIWEALSSGVPVVASPLIGHPQLLDGGIGMIVQDHTVQGWVSVLESLICGRITLRISENMELRTMKTVGAETAELYRKIAGSNCVPKSKNVISGKVK
jgi:glycosyltransferase involved in cell wall biosynthesis